MSRASFLSVLMGCVVVLAGAIALEFWDGIGDDADAASIVAIRPGSPASPSTAPAASGATAPAPALATEILARPLFASGRRPYQAEAASPDDAPVTDLPRLAGIVTIMDTKFAIFQPRDGGKPIVIGVGDTLHGRKIQAIGIDEIVLSGPDGSEHLRPLPDPALEHVSRPDPAAPIRGNARSRPNRRTIVRP